MPDKVDREISDALKRHLGVLEDFNRWRRGEPPYDWNEDPSKRVEPPWSPKEVGAAIDVAAGVVRAVLKTAGEEGPDGTVGTGGGDRPGKAGE